MKLDESGIKEKVSTNAETIANKGLELGVEAYLRTQDAVEKI